MSSSRSRCKRHPQQAVVGVCSQCLKERLLGLVEELQQQQQGAVHAHSNHEGHAAASTTPFFRANMHPATCKNPRHDHSIHHHENQGYDDAIAAHHNHYHHCHYHKKHFDDVGGAVQFCTHPTGHHGSMCSAATPRFKGSPLPGPSALPDPEYLLQEPSRRPAAVDVPHKKKKTSLWSLLQKHDNACDLPFQKHRKSADAKLSCKDNSTFSFISSSMQEVQESLCKGDPSSLLLSSPRLNGTAPVAPVAPVAGNTNCRHGCHDRPAPVAHATKKLLADDLMKTESKASVDGNGGSWLSSLFLRKGRRRSKSVSTAPCTNTPDVLDCTISSANRRPSNGALIPPRLSYDGAATRRTTCNAANDHHHSNSNKHSRSPKRDLVAERWHQNLLSLTNWASDMPHSNVPSLEIIKKIDTDGSKEEGKIDIYGSNEEGNIDIYGSKEEGSKSDKVSPLMSVLSNVIKASRVEEESNVFDLCEEEVEGVSSKATIKSVTTSPAGDYFSFSAVRSPPASHSQANVIEKKSASALKPKLSTNRLLNPATKSFNARLPVVRAAIDEISEDSEHAKNLFRPSKYKREPQSMTLSINDKLRNSTVNKQAPVASVVGSNDLSIVSTNPSRINNVGSSFTPSPPEGIPDRSAKSFLTKDYSAFSFYFSPLRRSKRRSSGMAAPSHQPYHNSAHTDLSCPARHSVDGSTPSLISCFLSDNTASEGICRKGR